MRVGSLVLAVLVVSGLCARGVRADERDYARAAFSAGEAADRAKDWRGAIEHYMRAYELVPHPFAIFNIATDYERLGQLREAATWYQRYLEAAPTSPDRAKVAQTLGELRTRPGSITVRSLPDGATVSIDGGNVGTTPYSGTIKGGNHRIIVASGGQIEHREITTEYGDPIDVVVNLGGASGELVVTSVPEGALVTVDNRSAGVTPAKLIVAPGPHEVKLSAYGYAPYTFTAQVPANDTSRVDGVLTRMNAIGDDSTPPGGGIVQPPGRIAASYTVGFVGGADLGGRGGLYEAELGGRLARYEAALRIGSLAGGLSLGFVVRWMLLQTRVTPYIAVAFNYGGGAAPPPAAGMGSGSSGISGYAWEADAGLRWDIVKADPLGVALLAQIGAAYYTVGDSEEGNQQTGAMYPVQLMIQLVKK